MSSTLELKEAGAPARRGNGPLTRRLTLQVAIVVALVAALIASVAWLTTRNIVMGQVDTQLQAAAQRQQRPGRGNNQPAPPGARELGNPIGTIFLQTKEGSTQVSMVTEGSLTVPTEEVTEILTSLPVDGKPRTVTLAGLGSYRAVASRAPDGDLRVAALPLHESHTLLRTLALVSLGLIMLAVLAAALITRLVVTRALRPLHRVAATANQVSRLELDRGEVELPQRVEEADALPTSEVGQVGHALNHLLANVETALAARQESETKVRRFVADASHELRNPLASIRGYAELTRRGREDLPPTAARALERIDAESARMGVLVEDLLLLARLDADPQLTSTPVDVVELVLDTVADARAAGPEHRWTMSLPDQPVQALGDPLRMTQVLANLLSNARTHTPAGTPVEVAVTSPGSRVEIRVTDNGPGIDPELLGSVFERFARADSSRAHTEEPSTGLGLAIVKALTEAMGGTVDVESRPGRTSFRLTFRAA